MNLKNIATNQYLRTVLGRRNLSSKDECFQFLLTRCDDRPVDVSVVEQVPDHLEDLLLSSVRELLSQSTVQHLERMELKPSKFENAR